MSYTKTIKLFSLKSWFRESASTNELMSRYSETGDMSLLSMLYDKVGPDLYYYLLVMSDPDVAADIAQKSWVKVIEKRHTYVPRDKFEAWLFTLARHLLFDESKKNQRLSFDSERIENQVGVSTMSEQHSGFHALLRRLPFAQREAFSLQQEGFSVKEIAEICHAPSETIKTRLRYARASLKQRMESNK